MIDTVQTYPQPREGVIGALRDDDDLLSLDDKALPRREMMATLARHLQTAVLVGNPAPIVAKMWDRMKNPQPGDLVLETSSLGRSDVEQRAMGFGFLLTHRDEWAQTDDEWAKEEVRPGYDEFDQPRPVEPRVYYVQYGPKPDDICRWVNCSFIAVPTDR
jgi:hypothetical protein